MTLAIEVNDLVVRYSRAEAVKGVSLQVESGSCHALFGRNGAGKTTLMRALLGLNRAASGSVRLFGLDLATHEAEVKSKISWVSDTPGFHPWMRVDEALTYAASLRTSWNPDLQTQLLSRFRLDVRAPVRTLSKGQRTQLALVSAIAADPELLILDEPTSGLDPLVRQQFIEAVIGVFQERDPSRKTVLISTHLISEFEGVVDHFTVLREGRVAMTSAADDARAKYQKPLQDIFLLAA